MKQEIPKEIAEEKLRELLHSIAREAPKAISALDKGDAGLLAELIKNIGRDINGAACYLDALFLITV